MNTKHRNSFKIPSPPDCLLLEDAALFEEGGIDFEIIVTGSSSEGNAKVEGCPDSGELLLCGSC